MPPELQIPRFARNDNDLSLPPEAFQLCLPHEPRCAYPHSLGRRKNRSLDRAAGLRRRVAGSGDERIAPAECGMWHAAWIELDPFDGEDGRRLHLADDPQLHRAT